jgi:hypothetical protein
MNAVQAVVIVPQVVKQERDGTSPFRRFLILFFVLIGGFRVDLERCAPAPVDDFEISTEYISIPVVPLNAHRVGCPRAHFYTGPIIPRPVGHIDMECTYCKLSLLFPLFILVFSQSHPQRVIGS